MLNILRDEFDKILIAAVLVLSMLLYYYKTSEVTAGWVGIVIGVLATLLTQLGQLAKDIVEIKTDLKYLLDSQGKGDL